MIRMLGLLAVLLSTPALATQDYGFHAIWTGAEIGDATKYVAVYLDGDRFVFVDRDGIVDGRAAYRVHGPGSPKGMALQYRADITVSTARSSGGKQVLGRAPDQSGTAHATFEVDGDAVRLCMGRVGGKGYPKLPRRGAKASKDGGQCFTLTQALTASPAAATPPGPKLHECMVECRQQNMMRAVSAEQIDADCQQTCGATADP